MVVIVESVQHFRFRLIKSFTGFQINYLIMRSSHFFNLMNLSNNRFNSFIRIMRNFHS